MTRKLKLLSFNVLAQEWIDPEYYPGIDPIALSWEHRKKMFLEKIFTETMLHDVDFVCLQEVSQQMVDEVLDVFAFYKNEWSCTDLAIDEKTNEPIIGCVILARYSQVDDQFIRLSIDDGKRSFGVSCTYDCGNEKLIVRNIHLEGHPNKSDVRAEQLRIATDFDSADMRGTKAVLVGDFNCELDYGSVELNMVDKNNGQVMPYHKHTFVTPTIPSKQVDHCVVFHGLASWNHEDWYNGAYEWGFSNFDGDDEEYNEGEFCDGGGILIRKGMVLPSMEWPSDHTIICRYLDMKDIVIVGK